MLSKKIIHMHTWVVSPTNKEARMCDILPDYWVMWNEFKDEIKSLGLQPYKMEDNWVIITNRLSTVKEIDKHIASTSMRMKADLKKNEFNPDNYTILNPEKLRDYQIGHVKKLMHWLKINNTALDTSPAGSGKTYAALNVAHSLGIEPYIITSKKGLKAWNDAIEEYDYKVLKVINYEKIRSSGDEYIIKTPGNILKGKKKKNGDHKRGKPKFKFSNKVKMVIFDEAHNCKNPTSVQSQIMKASKVQDIPRLLQSATIAENPAEFRMTGYALNLFDKLGDFMWWSKKFGVTFVQRLRLFKFDMKSASGKVHIQNLSDLLVNTCSSRMNKKDYEHHTSKNFIIPLVCKLAQDKIDTINKKYEILDQEAALRKKIMSMKQKLFIKSNETLTGMVTNPIPFNKIDFNWYQEYFNELDINLKSDDDIITYSDTLLDLLNSDNTDKLKAIGQFRKEIEELKLPIFKTLTDKFTAKGKYVVNFFNYREPAITLSEQLDCDLIIGGQKNADRNIIINKFQSGEINTIVATARTANESMSLHDTDGNMPRVSLINPDFSGTNLIQILGRLSRSGSMSDTYQYIIYIAGTYEENVLSIALTDVENIGTLNRGINYKSMFEETKHLNTIF